MKTLPQITIKPEHLLEPISRGIGGWKELDLDDLTLLSTISLQYDLRPSSLQILFGDTLAQTSNHAKGLFIVIP